MEDADDPVVDAGVARFGDSISRDVVEVARSWIGGT